MSLEQPLSFDENGGVTRKKIVYFVRHAEATHNVKEREAIERAKACGITKKEDHDKARRAILKQDPSLKDAPLSKSGTEQARSSGVQLSALFRDSSAAVNLSPMTASTGNSTTASPSSSSSMFRKPDVVLVSPLRRALMTATELFLDTDDPNEEPPLFLAIEALREKRTGLACDERHAVHVLEKDFPHVDFSNVQQGIPQVPVGEDNSAVRARATQYLDTRLANVHGTHIAIVSHKGWLRELRHTLKQRVDEGQLRADFDIEDWDTKLYGNAEVRIAAMKWLGDELVSVVSRSINSAAAMVGDGFEFALGPPSSGFSIFLAERTTKVHFISLPEGLHNVAVRNMASTKSLMDAENYLLPGNEPPSSHELYDARLSRKGAAQAGLLKQMLAQRPSGGRPFTAFDLVICSPLTRACETAQLIFGESPGTYGGQVLARPKILVREECRTRYGKYVCDGRRDMSEIANEFPDFDFSEVPTNEDVLHTDERESAIHCRQRAMQLLEWLSARPERCLAVVTHSEFLRHLFGQFGDTLHEKDRSMLQRTSISCELRSIVLCSHGSVESRQVQDAPPSTIRVPSGGSLTSLLETPMIH